MFGPVRRAWASLWWLFLVGTVGALVLAAGAAWVYFGNSPVTTPVADAASFSMPAHQGFSPHAYLMLPTATGDALPPTGAGCTSAGHRLFDPGLFPPSSSYQGRSYEAVIDLGTTWAHGQPVSCARASGPGLLYVDSRGPSLIMLVIGLLMTLIGGAFTVIGLWLRRLGAPHRGQLPGECGPPSQGLSA